MYRYISFFPILGKHRGIYTHYTVWIARSEDLEKFFSEILNFAIHYSIFLIHHQYLLLSLISSSLSSSTIMECTSINNNPQHRQSTTLKDHFPRRLINIPHYTPNSLERSLHPPEYSHDSERSFNIHQPQTLQSCPSEGVRPREIHRDHLTPQRTISTDEISEEPPMRTRSRRGDDDRFEQKELPKTINRVFGSIEDFLNFFVKRNPEIRDFAKQYQEIEETNDLERLNSIICPQFILSINKEAQKDSTSTSSEGNPAALFKMIFSSFDQFYGQILRAYTMNTFLIEI